MVAGSKRGKDGISGGGNSGEVPFKESLPPADGHTSRRGAIESQRAEDNAAKLWTKIQTKVVLFETHCWWCFCKCDGSEGVMHDPDACPSKDEPEGLMSDWDLPQSRIVIRLSKAKSAQPLRIGQTDPMARVQSMLPDEKRKTYYAAKKVEAKARRRAFDRAAQDRLRAWLKELKEPITPSGPLGHYTFYQKSAFEFALHLDRYMSEAQMQYAPGKLDRAAVQRFNQLVKVARLPSLEKARQRGDVTISGFVALRSRLLGPMLPQYERLLEVARTEEVSHSHNPNHEP